MVGLGLIVALACLLWLDRGCSSVKWSSDRALAYLSWLASGCTSAEWFSSGSRGGGEPGTKYFVLDRGSLRFQASPWGLKPELRPGGGCPGVSLDQFEMNFADRKGWAGDFVAVKHVDGRCAEVAIYCQGVVCQRHTFGYDAAGRAGRRTDTAYEGRRKGEGTLEWAKRFKGRTPAVAWVSEIEYAWSEDGRTVEVTLRAVHGKPQGLPTMWFEPPKGEPGQRLETWRFNGRGLITSVLRDGKVVYSAQYDDTGRLLRYEREGREEVENRYDAQGRLLETVAHSYGRLVTVVHAYPGGPRADLPQLKEHGDEAWLVTHDKYGRVSRIREHAGPPDDILANTFQEFRRDKEGRIIWYRVGLAR